MTLSFDEVIPRLLGLGAREPVLVEADRVAVIRDPKGLVRLAIDAKNATDSSRKGLERVLESELGKWYAGPAVYTDDPAPRSRIATEVLRRASDHWPSSWPKSAVDFVKGVDVAIDLSRWGAVQRVHSKETWLTDRVVRSPWPLREKTPTIVSFYSYKGGVGRSTLVAVVAAILARAGEKVVVIDLDLEAPGQQAIFDVEPTRGVVDYIVEHLAHGTGDIEQLFVDVTSQVADVPGSIHLAAGGRLGWGHVEKIARLDFVAQTQAEKSPVEEALIALLKHARKLTPDWILLDARTGIHDLGGLAMHALAHIDVLLARDGRQGRDGLDLCLEALTRRRKPEDILTLLVHALAPAPLDDDIVSAPVQKRFRDEAYELFKKSVYAGLDDSELPSADDLSAPHAPFPVPLDPTLGRTEQLHSMSDWLERSHYARIVERLRELASPEGDE